MRSRRPSPEHHEAVSQRLALLAEQLAAARDGAVAVGDEWWDEHTRVAPARPLHVVPDVREGGHTPGPPRLAPPEGGARLPPPAGRPVAPAAVPVPGRHADRRSVVWAALLPETLRGRVALAPGPVAVVAVLVAVGLAWTCWQVVRDDPSAPTALAPTDPAAAMGAPAGDLVAVGAVPTPPPDAADAGGAAAATLGTVTVDVAGRVRRPGIVVLDAGARVVDALERAGGARPSVDLTSLNLARPLVDGEQILVGVPGTAAAPVAGVPGAAAAPGAPALVDLNLADQTQLEALPDIGPVTAAAIISWRTEQGGFSAVTELLEVDGIGEATLETLTPLVTV